MQTSYITNPHIDKLEVQLDVQFQWTSLCKQSFFNVLVDTSEDDGGLFSRPKLTLYSPTISSWLPDSFIVGSPDSCCNLSTTRYEGCFVLYSLFPRRFFCHHSAQCCVPLALLDGSWQMPSMVSELAWLISHAKGHLLNLILRYL